MLFSCSENNTSPSTTPNIEYKSAITFTVTDNSGVATNISIDFGNNLISTNVFYIPRTRTELPSLVLKGIPGSGYRITPDITVARDYSNTQVFTVSNGGVTRTVYLSGFRKPTAVASGIMATDVVSLDYEITSDVLTNGVFALYKSDVTGITADDVLASATRLVRNLPGTNANTSIRDKEYLLAAYASTSARGSSSDIVPLTPNTEYNLYFAYDFVNGKQVLELITSTTQAATTSVLGATTGFVNFPTGGNIPLSETDTLIVPAILYNFNASANRQWRVSPPSTLLFNGGSPSVDATAGNYTQTIVTLNSDYTLVYLKKTTPLFQGASPGEFRSFQISYVFTTLVVTYLKD